ncbi:MAG: hypothetical protein H0W34_01260 [Pyrinomonadaceae bacterium]|nr:hypothetical protein [Pyrinomonadaceae bacterium]
MKKPVIRRTFPLSLFASAISLSAVCLLAPSTASALDFSIRPRINSGAMYYDFEYTEPAITIAGNDTLPFVGGGVTAFVDKFYVDVYAQGAFSGSDDDTFTSEAPGLAAFTGQTDWDRAEYALSFGYSLTDSFVVFAGYRRSDTEFDTEFMLPADTRSFSLELDNEQDGPFVGANYGWRIENSEFLDGTLALNLSAAYLDAEITGTFSSQDLPAQVLPEPTSLTGDTVGVTAGVTWNSKLIEPTGEGLFANGLNYTIGIDGYSYDFEDDEEMGSELSETVVRGSVGLSAPFNL